MTAPPVSSQGPTPGPARAAGSPYGWQVARVRGIPVYIGRSWPVIAAVIVVLFGRDMKLPGVLPYLISAAYAVLLLISVLVHEAGHAAAARAVGSRVDRIVVNLWGGHTVFSGIDLPPLRSAAVAVAGPVGNLVLAAVGWGLFQVVDAPVPLLLAWALQWANLLVAGFNMLPGLPLDGGHVVEALVRAVTGRRSTALVVAGWCGRVVTVLIALWFLTEPLRTRTAPDLYSMIWVGLIGAFLWQGATAAIRSGRARGMVAAVSLREVLRPVVVVPAHASAASVLAAHLDHPEAEQVLATDPAGAPLGFLDGAALATVPEDRLAQVPAMSFLLRPTPGWVVVAEPDADLTTVVESLAGHREGESVKQVVLVRDPAGRFLGTVSLGDVDAVLQRREQAS